MGHKKSFVEVAVGLPIRRTFAYEVPEPMRPLALPGKRVLVPFGRRFLSGFVIAPAQNLPADKRILPIRQVLDDGSSISASLLSFLLWVAKYYLQPIGEVIKTALPAGIHLRPREQYRINEQGLQSLKILPPESIESRVLKSLKRRGGKGLPSTFLRKDSSLAVRASLSRMIEEGLIEKEENIFEPKIREKTSPSIKFRSRADEACLTPLEKGALDFIQAAGELPAQEFKKKYKKASAILRKLETCKLVEVIPQEAYRQPSWVEVANWMDGPPELLTETQEKAVAAIIQAVHSRKFHPFLLHGVTGSGKTEVYLRAIEETVAQGRQALLLVPEIALTGQLVAYFRSRLDHPMAILHSGLTQGERYDEWRRIKKGLVKLVFGARSAIFAPLDQLGIIIVDEEHDPSYKQEEKVRYNARDLALVRGKMENAVTVLGSATPSMESYYNALEKKFHYLSLPSRVDLRPLPEIQVVDMRQEMREGKERPIFSRDLEEALRQNAERNEQALLFLNRRGFSTFALCQDCGFVYKCPNCSISLVYHLSDKSFHCHYCDYSIPAPSRCPQCASLSLLLFGLGTQRLEAEIKKRLPLVQVGRMDRDTTGRKSSHQRILNQVRRGEVNLLIGTQMITKGHDLPLVTLVGVLAADLSLNVPDFRASERTFQLLTQVAGRAGRGGLPGKVIIQTYHPHHYSIQMAQAQDFLPFYQQEAKFRQEMAYPPFARLINFLLEGNGEAKVARYSKRLEEIALRVLGQENRFQGQVEILGPAKAPLAKLKGKCRHQMLLKGKRWSVLHDFAEEVLQRAEGEIGLPGVKLIVDVDPMNLL
jgi:primosomal protein N' (replication factor Y)